MSKANDVRSPIDGLVMRNVSYEIQDNNNWLQITIDGREALCGIDIHYDESRGFFFDDGFLYSDIEKFGADVLNKIKESALKELNA